LEKNLPAKMAGVKEGDVVIEFGGTPIRTGEELRMRIRRTMPGSSVKIVVVRGTDKVEIPLMVGEA
jgi:serine protease Do